MRENGSYDSDAGQWESYGVQLPGYRQSDGAPC
jgi:hypothetical protein